MISSALRDDMESSTEPTEPPLYPTHSSTKITRIFWPNSLVPTLIAFEQTEE